MENFMYFWSWLLSPIPAAAIFLCFSASLAYHKRFRNAATVLFAGLATAGAVFVIKNMVARPRPSLNPTLWADDFSFPSGHAAAAACLAFLAVWFAREKHRKIIGIVAGLFALFVGISRIYFDVHYVSDVLAGYVVGACVAAIAVIVDRRLKMR